MAGQDLFGMALLDYSSGIRHRFDLERDDGYVNEQDLSVYFNVFEDFSAVEKKALEFARGKILDIGVGAGRTALHLQGKGHAVVGIDVSSGAIEVSRRRGVAKVLRMSACDLRFPKQSFDTALAFCNNLGLCGDMEGVRGMLRRLHGIVRDGGVFLASSIQPTRTDNKAHLRYQRTNRGRGRPPGQVTLRARYRGHVGDWWDLLMVTPSEMRELCASTGWKVHKIFRGYADMYVLVKA